MKNSDDVIASVTRSPRGLLTGFKCQHVDPLLPSVAYPFCCFTYTTNVF